MDTKKTITRDEALRQVRRVLNRAEEQHQRARKTFLDEFEANPLIAVAEYGESVMQTAHAYHLLNHHIEHWKAEQPDFDAGIEQMEHDLRRLRHDLMWAPWRHNSTNAIDNVANLAKASALVVAIQALEVAIDHAKAAERPQNPS